MVEFTVVKEGILIRPARQRLSLSERLTRYQPMEAEATEMMTWDAVGAEVVETAQPREPCSFADLAIWLAHQP